MNTPTLVGEVGYVGKDFPNIFLPDRLWLARAKGGGQRVDLQWLAYYLSSEPGAKAVKGLASGTSGSMKNIPKERLLALSVPIPPLDEQKQISAALSHLDQLISTLEILITKKQSIKVGMMQEFLTGKTRLPGFDRPWKVRSIREIVQTPVTDGPHMTPRFFASGIPFLSVNNLVDGKLDFDELRYVSRADHETFSRKCAPRKNDILLGKAASVGKVAFVDTDLEFNIWSPIAMIRLTNENSPKFVYYQLQSASVVNHIALLTNTSSQGNIGMADIEKLQINLPPRDEQRAISDALDDATFEIEVLKCRLVHSKAIKQGMMQELLTGRTRLPLPEKDS